MKLGMGYLLVLPLLLSCGYMSTAHAEDRVEVKESDHHGKHEYKMKVTRKGDHYVGFYNDREYVLRGDAAAHINADGDYVVYGDINPDQAYIETSEVQPTVVERREVIDRRDPVIIEKERRDPLIKVGPLEIGH